MKIHTKRKENFKKAQYIFLVSDRSCFLKMPAELMTDRLMAGAHIRIFFYLPDTMLIMNLDEKQTKNNNATQKRQNLN